jgi:regulator of replication initiation timing
LYEIFATAQNMSKDIRELMEGVRRNMSQLLDEMERLRDENEQLRRENKALREEVTLVRIFKDVSEQEEAFPIEDPESIPREAFALYRRLPRAFKFSDFFQLAERFGLDAAAARDCLLYFLREDMLRQKGARVEKLGGASESSNPTPQMEPEW